MANYKPVLRKREQYKDGTFNIKIRISAKGVDYVPTKHNVHWEQFDHDTGEVNDTHPNAKLINIELRKKVNTFDEKDLKLGDKSSRMTAKQLKQYHAMNNSKGILFRDFADTYLKECRLSVNTKQTYINALNALEEYNPAPITFHDMDEDFLKNLMDYLLEKYSVNSTRIYMSNYRALFNRAIDKRFIDAYPFRNIDIKQEFNERVSSIPVETFKLFLSTNVSEAQEKARDTLLLSFLLIGINYVDLINAGKDSVKSDRFYYNRSKTGRKYSIKLHEKAKELIEKYKGEDKLIDLGYDTSSSGIIRNHNTRIKIIGKNIGYEGDLTTYSVRYSWATYAHEIGVPKDTIRYALGHGRKEVVDSYIDYSLEKVDEANAKVIDYVFAG